MNSSYMFTLKIFLYTHDVVEVNKTYLHMKFFAHIVQFACVLACTCAITCISRQGRHYFILHEKQEKVIVKHKKLDLVFVNFNVYNSISRKAL